MNPYQNLCNDLYKAGDLLACYVYGRDGELKARQLGSTTLSDDLQAKFAGIAGVVWGGLSRVQEVAGGLRYLVAVYDDFKIVGVPIPGTNEAVVARVPLQIDSFVIRDRILGFVTPWHLSKT